MSDVEWRTVPTVPDYEASSDGAVRRRFVKAMGPQSRKEMRGTLHHSGYRQVTVRIDGRQRARYVHQLVAAAFHGAPEPGQQVRHLDGDKSNNIASNLAWGTVSDNTLDQVRHGTHQHSRRTHCENGHSLSGANLVHRRDGSRLCRECKNERQRAAYHRTALIEDGDEA